MGLTLSQYLGWDKRHHQGLTHRQHRVNLRWLEREWNNPSRSDYYLMALRAAVNNLPRLVWGEEPAPIDVNDLKLKFGNRDARKQLSEEDKAQFKEWEDDITKFTWRTRMEATREKKKKKK